MGDDDSVTLEGFAFDDPRLSLLKKRAQLADVDHALGKLARIWRFCYRRGTDTIPAELVATVLPVAALLPPVNLVELVEGGNVRVRGVGKRIRAAREREEALERQRQAGREGGRLGGRPRKRQPSEAVNPPGFAGGERGGSAPGAFQDREGDPEEVEGVQGETPNAETETPGVSQVRQASAFRRFTDAFDVLFQGSSGGAKPRWGGKEGKLVRELLALPGGVEEAIRRAGNMFEAAPGWISPPFTLATLHRHWDHFAARAGAASKANGARRDAGAELLARARELEEQGL